MTFTTTTPKICPYCIIMLFAILGISTVPAQAQQYLTIIAENDIYAPRAQDRHYTNGARIGYGLRQAEEGSWFSWLRDFVPFNSQDQSHHYELAFGQNIYTPEYYLASLPIPHDRPYAGWLYGELSINSHKPGVADDLSINLGMVGPVALAEQGQKLMHDIVGDPEPAGWDNQLRNEPTILVRYRRSWFLPLLEMTSLQSDVIPRLGFNIGNVFTDAGIGTAVRIGNYLPEQDLPLRIQPGLSGSSSNVPIRKNQFDWMLFAEIQGRAVIHNIFLDGNSFADSLSVNKRTFVRDLATGIVLGFGQLKLPIFVCFSVVWRGREFDLQQGGDSFGSAMIGMQY